MLSTSKLILPEPTYTPPDPSKKSHARRQPPGHVARPRNAFILFRCDFVRQKKIPQSVEKDHRNISRIVGSIWRGMSAQEREPWVKMAAEEKANHMKVHPGYRFTRGIFNGTRRTKRGDEAYHVQEEDLTSLSSDEGLLALDRAASCPAGALHMPTVSLEFVHGYGNPVQTRDDLERHIMKQHYYTEAVKEHQDAIKNDNANKNTAEEIQKEAVIEDENSEGFFCAPRLYTMQCPLPWVDRPLEPWEGRSSQASEPWADSLLGASINDVNGYLFQNSAPEFTNSFSSTLPPLPRCSIPYDFEGDYRTSFLSERKTSSFFSPRSGTWKLPPPIPNPSAMPADLDPSFALNRPYSSRKSLDTVQEESAASKHARDVVEEVLEEFSRQWFSDTMTPTGDRA